MFRRHATLVKQRFVKVINPQDQPKHASPPDNDDIRMNGPDAGPGAVYEIGIIQARMDVSHDSITITSIKDIECSDDERIRFNVWYKEELKATLRRASLENNQFYLRNLTPNTHCEIFFLEEIDGAETCITRQLVKTAFVGPPRNLLVMKNGEGNYSISWDEPFMDKDKLPISHYEIEARDFITKELKWIEKLDKHEFNKVIELNTLCSYNFSVRALSGSHVGSKAYEKAVHLRHSVLEKSILVGMSGPCKIYQIPLVEEDIPESKIKVKVYGIQKYMIHDKVIFIVGASGAGKTTWIHAFINYVLGVNKSDMFRFKIVKENEEHDQTVSKTENITIYKIHHQDGMNISFSFTLIDTPGFLDGSVEKDQDIQADICRLFKKNNSHVAHINAIGFVQQAPANRLTGNQKYLFGRVLSLFGKDIKDRIFLLLTFADTKTPSVLNAFAKAGISYSQHFKFNNAYIFPDNDEDFISNIYGAMWDMGMRNMGHFLTIVEDLDDKTTSRTADVLIEREKIRLHISILRRHVEDGLIKMEQLKTIEELLLSSQEFVHIKIITYKKLKDSSGKRHLVCETCKNTCHMNCLVSHGGELKDCIATDRSNGNICMMCVNKCALERHMLTDCYFERQVHSTKINLKTMSNQHQTTDPMCSENLLSDEANDLDAIASMIKVNLSEITQALHKLSQIALIQVPKTQIDYIDQLIFAEEHDTKHGYQVRVGILRNLRKEALDLASIHHDSFDPFWKYRKAAETARSNGQNMLHQIVWANIGKECSTRGGGHLIPIIYQQSSTYPKCDM